MTAPVTTGLPPVVVVEPPANPPGGGLYSAAQFDDRADPARLSSGAILESRNRGSHGLWPAGCGEAEPGAEKGGTFECPPFDEFPATVVWGSSDRKLPGTSEEDANLEAQQALRLYEPVDVEAFIAPLLVERAGTAATSADAEGSALVGALSAVESAASYNGLPLVIHAPRSAAAVAAYRGLVQRVGGRAGRLETPLGNVWAFGTGYGEALNGLLVATGPVTVHRSSIETNVGVELASNARTVIAEREVVVTWDGPTVAAQY